MGITSSGVKKLNIHMNEPEFFDLVHFHVGIYSARGSKAKARAKNEDCCGFVSPTATQVAMIVADGMGGHSLGDRASKITVNSILGRSTQRRRPFKPAQMIEKIERAHQQIKALQSDAGSTLAMAVLEGEGLWFYSMGDSLGLLLADTGQVIYKTFEHSVVGFATEAGLMEEKEAQSHEQSNEILNGLGFSDTRLESSLRLSISSGQTVVLCSDGLTEIFTVDELAHRLKAADFQAGVQSLVEKATELRGDMQQFDDLSLVVCRKK